MKQILACFALLTLACSDIQLDPRQEIIHVRFDPDESAIPMPTDILRDSAAGRLDLPLDDDDITPAEREFYTYLNTLDGWSTTMPATVELTGPIEPATVTHDTLQVWQWGLVPQPVEGVQIEIRDDEQEITIEPPRHGWERGGTYVVLVRGGTRGIEGKRGELVECDAAYYFLRQTEPLNTKDHERAFPGETRKERMENGEDLEEIRVELAPYLDYFASTGIPRQEIAALWSFTTTERVELAMDKVSQRMPLPINLLLDPNTGRVDIPVAKWDREVEIDAKHRLRELDGFGTSTHLMFEMTGAIDPDTFTNETVKLYELAMPPVELPAKIEVFEDGAHAQIIPETLPLKEQTSYAVVVSRSVRDAFDGEIIEMPVGHFLKSHTAVLVDSVSEVEAIADEDATKIERVRTEIAPLLDSLDRAQVLAAWSFTTMSIHEHLVEAVELPERLNLPVDPENVSHMTPQEARQDFTYGAMSQRSVGHIYNGTIKSADFIDRRTRAWRVDGEHTVQDLGFTMTVPRDANPEEPLPVVIFGHAIMNERRFVLAIGDTLAQRGFAAIAIDFPLHGSRTQCYNGGPLSVIDPETGEETSEDPCQEGTMCSEDGRCVDELGNGNALALWPSLNMPIASGAPFIDVDRVANTNDHARQAVIDLATLSRALRNGDWEPAIGYRLKTDELYYVGMSLGGVIGATFVPLSPEITRAVLNVPGADMVDLFADSPFFGPHVDAFFKREEVTKPSWESEKFMNVGRWFMDRTDPLSVAPLMLQNREVFIQMARWDFIIPNEYTLKLEEKSGAPRRDYDGEHAMLIIPFEPAYLPCLNDMASFLIGELEL